MKVPFHGLDARYCSRHYCMSQKGGGYHGFSGARYQRGSGGIGDFFGGLYHQAIPFIKQGLLGVGKYALRSGAKFLDSLESGQSVKEAARERWRAAKDDAITKITGGQVGTGKIYKKKKKRCCRRRRQTRTTTSKRRERNTTTTRRTKRRRTKSDIFD